MQKRTKARPLISICLVMINTLLIASCGGGDPAPASPKTPEDEVRDLLVAHPWKLMSATVDGIDKTAVYDGLTITFTSISYHSTNGGPIWPSTGSWSFSNNDASAIKRDDGLVVQVLVSESTLKLTFTWSKMTLGGGRVSSLNGQHILHLIK